MVCDELDDAKRELILIVNSFDITDDISAAQFREHMLDWFEKYQNFALESLCQYYKENKLSSSSMLCEILELMGIANLNDLDKQVDLLKYFFTIGNLQMRHGAVEGISNLNPQLAVQILEDILIKQEESTVLKNIISSYIDQLKTIKNN